MFINIHNFFSVFVIITFVQAEIEVDIGFWKSFYMIFETFRIFCPKIKLRMLVGE